MSGRVEGGGGKVWLGGGSGGCERRIEVFEKNHQKNWGFGGVRVGRVRVGEVRVDVNEELKFL